MASWLGPATWAVAGFATALTLWFSLGPAPPGPGSDRALHAGAYVVDTLAILVAVVGRPGRRPAPDVWIAPIAIGIVLLGGAIEIVQGGLGRDSQLTDWIADAVGAVVGVLLFVVVRRTLPRPPAEGGTGTV